MLSDERRAALMLEMHRAIEEAATQAAEVIAGVQPVTAFGYPPNGGLSDAETSLIRSGGRGVDAVPALRKIVAEAASVPLFRLFGLIDGVGDPDDWDGVWSPIELSEALEDEDQPMLHDELFESYWAWVERREDPGWRLDSAESS